MNFLGNLLTKSPAANFNYNIGDKVDNYNDAFNPMSLWDLHDGTKKDDQKTPVSIFSFDKKANPDESIISLLKSTILRSKTLRHPGCVTYLEDFDTPEKLYLVTEHAIPLKIQFQEYKNREGQKIEAAAQGLFSIANTLKFMHEAGLVHDNICSSSIFVDRAGLWKLMGLEYVHKVTDPATRKVQNALTRYDPPEIDKNSKNKRIIVAGDTWRMGCLQEGGS